jgi:hypothetical protein
MKIFRHFKLGDWLFILVELCWIAWIIIGLANKP